jgi:type III pantothenate kinase
VEKLWKYQQKYGRFVDKIFNNCKPSANQSPMTISNSLSWLAVMIGNSRLHWAGFYGEKLEATWDTPHLTQPLRSEKFNAEFFPSSLIDNLLGNCPLYIATVVPQQTIFFESHAQAQFMTLEQIPLSGIYDTLGIDRALALWGLGERYGFPGLVIDAGTALTLTGANSHQTLVGGAILPGLKLQLNALFLKTAALPEVNLSEQLPQRWATSTTGAIQSGIIYTVLAGIKAFIEEWWTQFPRSCIALTGGDANLLMSYLKCQYPEIGNRLILDRHLIFWGMRSLTKVKRQQ